MFREVFAIKMEVARQHLKIENDYASLNNRIKINTNSDNITRPNEKSTTGTRAL